MLSAEAYERKIEELERRCRALQEQVHRVEEERITYLQNVSHQLVAPLNAIKWHIENITQNRIGVDRAKKVLRSIYSQSTIAVHLAKNFALMSNLDKDHALSALKEPLDEVHLCALLINLADDFQPLGWDRSIQIGVETQEFEKAPKVLAMRPLINQVFSNIIENAVKYANPDSNVRVWGGYDKRSDSVLVAVASRGIPLPPNPTDVFERGFRSDQAKNRYPAGTGFGLYIARRIVEIHEGKIEANMSDRGEAIFTVALSVRSLQGKARRRDEKDRSPGR